LMLGLSDELRAVLFIPERPFATVEARKVVPAQFSRSDAIFNASRCALLVRALALGDHAGLRVAMQDRWHQDARFALMPGTEAIVDAAIDAGADDVTSSDDGHQIFTTPENLRDVAKALESKFGEPRKSAMLWKPQNTVALDDAAGEKMLKMIEALDDNDDVQNVYANFEVSDALMKKMSD